MTVATITTGDYEEALRLWGWGAWARTAWIRPLKQPGWVKQIKTLDRETELRTVITPIDDRYGQELDAKISRLPEQYRDILVNIYVNLLSVHDTARDMQLSRYTVTKEQDRALALLYGGMFDFDFNSL